MGILLSKIADKNHKTVKAVAAPRPEYYVGDSLLRTVPSLAVCDVISSAKLGLHAHDYERVIKNIDRVTSGKYFVPPGFVNILRDLKQEAVEKQEKHKRWPPKAPPPAQDTMENQMPSSATLIDYGKMPLPLTSQQRPVMNPPVNNSHRDNGKTKFSSAAGASQLLHYYYYATEVDYQNNGKESFSNLFSLARQDISLGYYECAIRNINRAIKFADPQTEHALLYLKHQAEKALDERLHGISDKDRSAKPKPNCLYVTKEDVSLEPYNALVEILECGYKDLNAKNYNTVIENMTYFLPDYRSAKCRYKIFELRGLAYERLSDDDSEIADTLKDEYFPNKVSCTPEQSIAQTLKSRGPESRFWATKVIERDLSSLSDCLSKTQKHLELARELFQQVSLKD